MGRRTGLCLCRTGRRNSSAILPMKGASNHMLPQPPYMQIRLSNHTAFPVILAPFDHVYGIAGHDGNSWKVQIDHTHGWHGTPWIAHTLAEVRGSG